MDMYQILIMEKPGQTWKPLNEPPAPYSDARPTALLAADGLDVYAVALRRCDDPWGQIEIVHVAQSPVKQIEPGGRVGW